MKLISLTLNVTMRKDYILKCEDYNEAEALAFLKFKKENPNLDIKEYYGSNFSKEEI